MLLLLAFSFPSWGLLSVLAMSLLWVGLREANLASATVVGTVTGLVFFLGHLYWLDASIGREAWVILAITQTVYVMLACVAIRAVMVLPAAPLWCALIWTSVETLRASWPLGGMPWGRLGYSVVETPANGLLPALGVDGTSATLALSGFLLGQTVSRAGSVRARLLSFAGAGGLIVTAIWLPVGQDSSGSLRVAVVQGGVPSDGTDLLRFHREVTRNHVSATTTLAAQLRERSRQVDLVLWPENSTAVDPMSDSSTRALLEDVTEELDAPLVFGGIADGPTSASAFNRTFIWDRGADRVQPRAAYTKQHLVPFGEYLPWRSLIEDWSPRFDMIPRDMLPGKNGQTATIAGTRLAVAICFDIAYDDVVPDQVRRGASAVLVQTSNATFFGTGQLDQQLTITRARALESARSVVVASTNGLSAVVAPDGRVRDSAPRGTTATLVSQIDLSESITPAVAWQTARQAGMAALTALSIVAAAWLASARRTAAETTWRRSADRSRRG
ncbi:apolipoprotein N-acyltransferase [Aeromicrobium sp. CTD01-1L150]|uniref:apolipoprotein N-acyltransferase n=1 Tax=Aeromicrobium sp. CTD01-1L150 TaxID=3341830 RepID=UPI0035BEC2CA